jgi:hypothetical protein
MGVYKVVPVIFCLKINAMTSCKSNQIRGFRIVGLAPDISYTNGSRGVTSDNNVTRQETIPGGDPLGQCKWSFCNRVCGSYLRDCVKVFVAAEFLSNSDQEPMAAGLLGAGCNWASVANSSVSLHRTFFVRKEKKIHNSSHVRLLSTPAFL